MVRILLILNILILFVVPSKAQNDERPTLRFNSGDLVHGPKSGATSRIPEGWMGVMPRGSELFLLLPNNGGDGEIYIYRSPLIDENERRANWQAGLDLGNGNVLKSDGNILRNEQGNLMSNLVLDEKTSHRKGYIELVCGEFGYCLSALVLAAPEKIPGMKEVLKSFLDELQWEDASDYVPYAQFNWQEFLSGKHLLNHDYVQQAKFENDLWLCPDGRFFSKVKRSGTLKGAAGQYKGKKKGTWEISSIGPTGQLVLNFDKLEPLEVTMEINDEKIYLNGKRHFVLNYSDCK